jgi:hypothetical protein
MKRESQAVFFARAEAVLLMDRGPNAELVERLQFALDNCIPSQRENALEFDAWVREQANSAR